MLEELLRKRNLPPLLSREEMRIVLQREVFGFLPPPPEKLRFELVKEEKRFCAGKADHFFMMAHCTVKGKDFSFPFDVALPRSDQPCPFFVYPAFEGTLPNRYYPTEEIVDNGFAVISFCYQDVAPDRDDDFLTGLSAVLYENGHREMYDAGKIAMWAWAAMRLLDYAATMPDKFDLARAGVCGHSRLGKTALFAGAMDERFRFVYSNDSGCSGAALSRQKIGEDVYFITRKFHRWFNLRYLEHGREKENEDKMPFDQHYLLACIAPRCLLVGSATEDEWADPESEFLSCLAATPAFDGDFIHPDRLPEADECFLQGRLSYHLRTGPHFFSREDWNRLIRFVRLHETN